MKKRLILFFAVVVVGFMIAFTEFFGNAYSLATCRGYFIPEESNIFIFRVTEWNDGSGEWWLQGEDGSYYYTLNTEADYTPKNYKVQKRLESVGFYNLSEAKVTRITERFQVMIFPLGTHADDRALITDSVTGYIETQIVYDENGKAALFYRGGSEGLIPYTYDKGVFKLNKDVYYDLYGIGDDWNYIDEAFSIEKDCWFK